MNFLEQHALNSTRTIIGNGFELALNETKLGISPPILTIQNKCVTDFSLYDKLVTKVFIDNLMLLLLIHIILDILRTLILFLPEKYNKYLTRFKVPNINIKQLLIMMCNIIMKKENINYKIELVEIDLLTEILEIIRYLMMVELLIMAWYLYF